MEKVWIDKRFQGSSEGFALNIYISRSPSETENGVKIST